MHRSSLARRVRALTAAAGAAAAVTWGGTPALAASGTWVPDAGSWAVPANWSSGTVPNGVGEVATFPAVPSATRTVTVDSGSSGFTVGGVVFNNDVTTSAINTAVNTGTSGSKLILNNGGAGVTITAAGTGLGNNTIAAPMTLSDAVLANVTATAASSAAGALNLTSTMTGTGGFTKAGDGLATFGTGAKTYTGPTVINGGRMRISLAAQPSATSSFTINAGGQLTLISASPYTFGGPLNLNGVGATSGPYAAFPGAIRNDTGITAAISNPVVLQSNSVIHVQASSGTGATATPNGSLTLTGAISGPGGLQFTATGSNVDQGTLELSGASSYTGGTTVAGGILRVSGAAATLGVGSVTVINPAAAPTPYASIARLQIVSGVTNAIADTATLSLAGGGTPGVADQGWADLGAGVNESVGGLVLGGVPQLVPGTYGSTASAATFKSDEYFAGTGVVTLVPEPGTAGLAATVAAGLLFRRRARGRRA
ncbi:MAG TPA: autotransporter-associated beta strand repeat-containing protein [Humisphaera sp.]